MQSILQYRQLRKRISEQHSRGQQKLAQARDPPSNPTVGRPDSPTHPSSELSLPSSTVRSASSTTPPSRDLEKAEDSRNDIVRNEYAAEDGGSLSVHESHVERIQTLDAQRTRGSMLGRAMTGVSVRKPTTKEGGGSDEIFVVGFEGEEDPMNPHNWPFTKRWGATINVALIGWIVGFASSIDSGALQQAAEAFGVSEVVESLATALFLVGFGCGALVAGPFSEEFGRNIIYISTLSLYMVFIMASALAPNIGAQCAFRFLAGFFGSTPLSCAGGSLSDLWSPVERVWAFPVFANAAFMGPIIGPVVGSWIGQEIDWRWCEWVTLLGSAAVLCSVVLLQPETYAPILLKWKAKHLRAITGDDRYVASVEIRDQTFADRVKQALYRPFIMTAREPIILLFGLYLTVVYIILFGFLNGYTFIFTETYGLSQGLTGLCFLGIAVGLCFASVLIPFVKKHYERSTKAAEDRAHVHANQSNHTNSDVPPPKPKVDPEIRLIWAMLGAPAIPISLFWMGWTARSDISLASPLVASVVFGYGILCIFISVYQYLIDSYELFAASALASVTLIRYVAAGGMVVVSIPFYENLGVGKTLSVLGGISAAMVPVPYLFYIYGKKVRSWSKFAVA